MASLETEKAQNLPPLVYVEPAKFQYKDFFQPGHSRVKPSTRHSSQLTQSSDETVTRSANTAYVMLANFSEETLTVPKYTVLGVAQQVSEELIFKINAESEPDSDRSLTRKKNEALYKKLLPGKLDHLTNDDRRHIEPILEKDAHLFHDEKENDFKCTNEMEH